MLQIIQGDIIKEISQVKDILKNQVISSVLWEKSILTMINNGVDTFIEIGPGKTLCGFVKKINKDVRTFNVEDIDSLNNTIGSLN